MKKILIITLIFLVCQISFGQQRQLEKPIYNCNNWEKKYTSLKNCEDIYKRELNEYNQEIKRLNNIYTKRYNNLLDAEQNQELLFTPNVKNAVSIVQSINNLEEFKRQRETYNNILENIMSIRTKSESDWAHGNEAAVFIGKTTSYVDNLFNKLTQRQEMANNIRKELYQISFKETSNGNDVVNNTNRNQNYNNQETNYSNSNNYQNSQTESIYEKRRREAQEAKNRRQQAENKRRNEAKRFLDNEKKSYERYNAAMDKIDQQVDNFFGAIAERQKRENDRKEAEWEEQERLNDIKREQRRREIRERNRREEEERIKKERIKTAKIQFMNSLTDAKIPLSYSTAKAYFILLVKINDEEIKLSKVTLHKNSDNQLPYKQDVLNKFKKKHNVKDIFVYGAYSSQQQQDNHYKSIKRDAQSSYINIGNDITFSYNKSGTVKAKTSNTDFWGNKKKKTTTTKKKSSDFWD